MSSTFGHIWSVAETVDRTSEDTIELYESWLIALCFTYQFRADLHYEAQSLVGQITAEHACMCAVSIVSRRPAMPVAFQAKQSRALNTEVDTEIHRFSEDCKIEPSRSRRSYVTTIDGQTCIWPHINHLTQKVNQIRNKSDVSWHQRCKQSLPPLQIQDKTE